MNIAGFEDGATFTLVLVYAGVVTAADQAAAPKDLFGSGVMSRVANSSGQASHLQITEPLEGGPNPVGGLGHQVHQTIFHGGQALLDGI